MTDFTTTIKDLDGIDTMTQAIDSDGKPFLRKLTLSEVCTTSLLANYDDERALSGEEKVRRFLLATKVHDGSVQLTAEDIVLIKRLIAKSYGPLVCGQSWKLLDPSA